MQEECFLLINQIANNTKDLIAIYHEEKLCYTNSAFNSFFGVTSNEDFTTEFQSIQNCFVPHPSYFNAEKIASNQTWIEAILELEPLDRIVSFLSQKHDPHAFSVTIDEVLEKYKVITFNDITQTLIKRILIENNMNIDAKTHAYTKEYFLHIKQSFEDAARFNEKLIGLTLIEVEQEAKDPANLVDILKKHTRDDDMIIAWDVDKYLLAYLVEDRSKGEMVDKKLQEVLQQHCTQNLQYTVSSIFQKEKEGIAHMLRNFRA